MRRFREGCAILLLAAGTACSPRPSTPAPEPRSTAVADPTRKEPQAEASTRRDAFWLVWDLDHPALSGVRQQLERGEEREARASLATHFRTRAGGWFLEDGETPVRAAQPEAGGRRLLETTGAERALRGEFQVMGRWRSFDRPDLYVYPEGFAHTQDDDHWMQQFNRHHAWIELGEAWSNTGNPLYAEKLAELINLWLTHSPNPAPDADAASLEPARRTIDTGIRLGQTWPRLFSRVRQCPALDDDLMLRWLASMAAQADFLMARRSSGNWLLFENEGLLVTGSLFPEFRNAARWRETALRSFDEESRKQILADGGQYELTPWYHYGSLKSFEYPLMIARHAGVDVPAALWSRLESMYAWMYLGAEPDGRMPPLNDSEELGVRAILRRGARLHPHRGDFLWFATGGREGTAPTTRSLLRRPSGQAVMRSGWDPDASFLLMECGTYGAGGHQHEDKLHFVLTSHRQRFFIDSRRHRYNGSAQHKFSLGPGAHSTLLIQGVGQHRRPHWEALMQMDTGPDDWRSGEGYDYVCATYGANPLEGWGETWSRESRRLGTHRREILFLHPDLWIGIDRIRPGGELDALSTVEALFCMDPSLEILVEGTALVARRPGAAVLRMQQAEVPGLSLRVARGEGAPRYLGWLLSETQEPVPAPTAIYTVKNGGGELWMAWAITTRPRGEPPPMQVRWIPSETDRVLRVGVGERQWDIVPAGEDGKGARWREIPRKEAGP